MLYCIFIVHAAHIHKALFGYAYILLKLNVSLKSWPSMPFSFIKFGQIFKTMVKFSFTWKTMVCILHRSQLNSCWVCIENWWTLHDRSPSQFLGGGVGGGLAILTLWAPPIGAAYAPLHSTSSTGDPAVRATTTPEPVYTPLFTIHVLYICISRIKSVYSRWLYYSHLIVSSTYWWPRLFTLIVIHFPSSFSQLRHTQILINYTHRRFLREAQVHVPLMEMSLISPSPCCLLQANTETITPLPCFLSLWPSSLCVFVEVALYS